MRHLRSDVSHRIRRRRPSIFSARWFRLLLGVGSAVVLALVMGPPIVGWLRTDPGASHPAARPSRAEPGPAPGVAGSGRPDPALAVVAASPEVPSPQRPVAQGAAVDTRPPGGAGGAPPAVAPTASVAPADSGAGGAYRVQVGAFLDHRNADRLAERLRAEGLEITDSVIEEQRVLYRVRVDPRSEESSENLLARLRTLGLSPEVTDDGIVASEPVPLRDAIETSRRLRGNGLMVRLEKAMGTAPYRVVRVGRFATFDEADRARGELAARGVAGFVVRER